MSLPDEPLKPLMRAVSNYRLYTEVLSHELQAKISTMFVDNG